jgi:hypothetical protein
MRRKLVIFDARHLMRTVIEIYVSGLDLEVVRASSEEKVRALLRADDVAAVVADLDDTPAAAQLVESSWLLDPEGVRLIPAILFAENPELAEPVTPDHIVLAKPVYRETFRNVIRRLLPQTAQRG